MELLNHCKYLGSLFTEGYQMENYIQQAKKHFEGSIQLKQQVLDTSAFEILATMAAKITKSLQAGGKLMLCGNGGSAADAQHLAAELLIRLRPHVNRNALPAISLATDISSVTACGNDYGFDEIFSRPLSGLGNAGDVVLGITTSGKSPNVLKAFETAKSMNITCMGFLGGAMNGQPAAKLCDDAFIVPSAHTAHIQECHISAGHILMELIEDMMLASGSIHQF
jgi:D-sedoheptulose 7-phosphate isomerase